MALVAGEGSLGKNKLIKVSFEGFIGRTGSTSNFGDGSEINCENVEFFSIEKPEKSENEVIEKQSNLRTIKDDSATDGWEDWSGLTVYSDAEGVNWRAFVAAQETDAEGTLTISIGDKVLGKWKAKIAKAGGGGGDASAFDEGFTPTIRLLKSLPADGSDTE